jgi:hypothetical protein
VYLCHVDVSRTIMKTMTMMFFLLMSRVEAEEQ